MKIANSVKISVFVKEEEDESKIRNKLLELFPFDLQEEKIEVKEQNTTGFTEKKIKVLEVILEKDKHIEAFLGKLAERVSDEAKELLGKQLESRLDEDCNFFLRFSKDKMIEENEFWLTDQGNCFHIKINVAAFPKKKEIALDIIKKVFGV